MTHRIFSNDEMTTSVQSTESYATPLQVTVNSPKPRRQNNLSLSIPNTEVKPPTLTIDQNSRTLSNECSTINNTTVNHVNHTVEEGENIPIEKTVIRSFAASRYRRSDSESEDQFLKYEMKLDVDGRNHQMDLAKANHTSPSHVIPYVDFEDFEKRYRENRSSRKRNRHKPDE